MVTRSRPESFFALLTSFPSAMEMRATCRARLTTCQHVPAHSLQLRVMNTAHAEEVRLVERVAVLRERHDVVGVQGRVGAGPSEKETYATETVISGDDGTPNVRPERGVVDIRHVDSPT